MKLNLKQWFNMCHCKARTLRHNIMLYHRKVTTYKQGVVHATFDPKGPGVVRLHLIPPKPSFWHDPDSLLVVQGYYLINVGHAFAVILRIFIQELVKRCPTNREVSMEEVKAIEKETVRQVKRYYPKVSEDRIRLDLRQLVTLAIDIGQGNDLPEELMNGMSLDNYLKHATGPQRMDLLVAPMTLKGKKCCPLDCGVCYAQDQEMMNLNKPLSTRQWKMIIDKCRQAGIPMLTFTGGEPLTRHDIVELVEHAKWFITRINTNGYLLTRELARELYEASLDGIQITLYSYDPKIHDKLVNTKGAWQKTVEGIKNALEAGLMISVNTPLLELNKNYNQTLAFLHQLGVRCVTCSGLIPTGGAEKEMAGGNALSYEEMKQVLAKAVVVCNELAIDIGFTSPGWMIPKEIDEIGLPSTPICGACASNMAIAPNGDVIPCQSWLDGTILGNMLKDTWKHIWKHKICHKIQRKYTYKGQCALKKEA
ncbi:MAG: radical SAM protein [Candidatus Shapirobacteria bacterium]|nr:radical SAM protein [Candidatus Shapirobacteria bacterium]